MAKRRNLNVVGFEALGTAFGQATSEAVAVKSPVDRRVAEARAKGIKDSLALLREALPAKANHDFYDTVALRAANKVRVANGLDKLDSLLASASGTPSKTTGKKDAKETKPSKTKTSASTGASGTPSKTTGKKSTPKLDRYDIDEGDQCHGTTRKGTQCKHWGINGTGYCLQHQSQASGTPSKTTGEKDATDGSTTDAEAFISDAKASTEEYMARLAEEEDDASPAKTAGEAKPGRKSTREKMIDRKKAIESAPSEAEMAEAAAEADWIAAELKLDIAEDAAEVNTSMATAFAVEALRASDI